MRFALGMSRVGNQWEKSDGLLSSRRGVIDDLSELGTVLLDPSPLYGGGFSERFVGEIIANKRDKFFVATKFYPKPSDDSRSVVLSVKKSLKNLETDHIDLLQMHWTHPNIQLDEILEAFDLLVSQGLVKSLGLSSFTGAEIEELMQSFHSPRLLSNQVELHLGNFVFKDSWNHPKVPWTLAYSALLQGRLTYSSNQRQELERLAKENDVSSASLALACLMSSSEFLIPILRISSREHLSDLMGPLITPLDHIDFSSILEMPPAQIFYLHPDQIQLEGDGFRKPYLSISEAVENLLDLIPSPVALGKRLENNDILLPVMVSLTNDGKFVLDNKDPLNEVKRYWAWRLARPNQDVPVIVMP